jgi:hypothetical protein
VVLVECKQFEEAVAVVQPDVAGTVVDHPDVAGTVV